MEVTVVSHAGIANRIKNLLSAMVQHEKVNTLHETMSSVSYTHLRAHET